MSSQELNCGLDCPNVPDLFAGLAAVDDLQYNFISLPIVHPRLRRRYKAGGRAELTSFTRSDMLLDPGDWSTRVVARMSPHLCPDSPIVEVRQQHEDALMEELNYCRGLGINTVMFTLNRSNNTNLARIITGHFNSSHFSPGFWIQVPMENPAMRAFDADANLYDDSDERLDTWRWWSDLHRLTEWDRRISLVLRLSADMPSKEEIKRWLGEPIKCLVIPTHVFCTNKRRCPVLSRAHQDFISQLFDRDIQMMVTGVNRHEDMAHYVRYLRYLWKSKPTSHDAMINYARGWEDYLQTPLQPLSDNLDSYTYSVFEKDPIKYNYYQDATVEALKARYQHKVTCKGIIQPSDTKAIPNGVSETADVTCPNKDGDGLCGCKHYCVVMVLGAGRGPLVRAVLNAACIANVNVKVYAVEKNPTALVTLHVQQREVWGDKVTVVANDMRKYKAEELADIIVSELLGSFGDNELSPECLDYAGHLFKEDGISIPSSYTSFIAPVMCPRLWGLARASEREPTQNRITSLPHPLETPWVVYLQNKYEIAPPQELFRFEHPCTLGDGDDVERRRWKSLKFPVAHACTLHGFSGYFSCTLFEDVCLSIVPETHTKGMISWFPIFFPIKCPILLKANQEVEVQFWRCCNARKVWYEWSVTSPELQGVHNSAGKSSDMIL